MPEYLSEMALYSPSKHADTTYPYFDHYWREPDRFPYIIQEPIQQGEREGERQGERQGERDCGFALVRKHTSGDETPHYHSIAEFFIRKPSRRQGTGQQAVKGLLAQHDSLWLIQVLEQNKPALHFWQKTLEDIYQCSLEPSLEAGFYNFTLAR